MKFGFGGVSRKLLNNLTVSQATGVGMAKNIVWLGVGQSKIWLGGVTRQLANNWRVSQATGVGVVENDVWLWGLDKVKFGLGASQENSQTTRRCLKQRPKMTLGLGVAPSEVWLGGLTRKLSNN